VVIAKGEMFNIMYSLGLLIVDLETARRRLLDVFEVPDGTRTSGRRTRPIPDGPHSIGLLTRFETPLDRLRADTRAFFVSPNAEEQSQAMANDNVLPEKTIDSSRELWKL
jgi:hypothetical protein